MTTPNNIPWNSSGIRVVSGGTKLTLQGWRAKNDVCIEEVNTTDVFTSGDTYNIEFGMYDISDTAVRIILKVNEKVVFNVVSEEAVFHSASGHFGVYVEGANLTATISGVEVEEEPGGSTEPEETYTELAVNDMLADITNWSDFRVHDGASGAPAFQDGAISLKGTSDFNLAGYNTAYKNTVYKFKYKHDRDTSGLGGFYISLGAPNNIPWNVKGILVTSGSQLTIQVYNKVNNAVIEKVSTDFAKFEKDTEYEIEFGMYDISDTQVRIILKVNEKVVFNVVSEEAAFHSASGHFGIYVEGANLTATVSGVQAVQA